MNKEKEPKRQKKKRKYKQKSKSRKYKKNSQGLKSIDERANKITKEVNDKRAENKYRIKLIKNEKKLKQKGCKERIAEHKKKMLKNMQRHQVLQKQAKDLIKELPMTLIPMDTPTKAQMQRLQKEN